MNVPKAYSLRGFAHGRLQGVFWGCLVTIYRGFLLLLAEFSFWWGGGLGAGRWALGYHFMEFGLFPNIT